MISMYFMICLPRGSGPLLRSLSPVGRTRGDPDRHGRRNLFGEIAAVPLTRENRARDGRPDPGGGAPEGAAATMSPVRAVSAGRTGGHEFQREVGVELAELLGGVLAVEPVPADEVDAQRQHRARDPLDVDLRERPVGDAAGDGVPEELVGA